MGGRLAVDGDTETNAAYVLVMSHSDVTEGSFDFDFISRSLIDSFAVVPSD